VSHEPATPTADDLARAAAARLAALTGADTHDVAVVLGSGWVPAADASGRPTPRGR
jgi:purine-nucleoside phosphorylase